MSNESQDVTFLSRLKQKWFLIVLGSAICYFVGIGLGKSEQYSKSQKATDAHMLKNVVAIDAETIVSKNEGKLVHVSGRVTVSQIPKDELLGVDVQGVALKRRVKMYQLFERVEERQQRKLGPKKIGDEQGEYETVRTYRYEGEWREDLINSDDFQNTSWTNPKEFPYPDAVFVGKDVTLGAFKLSNDHLTNSNDFQSYELDASVIKGLQERLGRNVFFEEKSDRFPARIFIGFGTIDNPRVGDVKVSYEILPVGDYSVMGLQKEEEIVPYQVEDSSIALMGKGLKNPEELMENKRFASNFMTWLFRVLAVLFMCGGFAIVFWAFSSVNHGVMSLVMRPGTFIVALTAALLTIGLIIHLA